MKRSTFWLVFLLIITISLSLFLTVVRNRVVNIMKASSVKRSDMNYLEMKTKQAGKSPDRKFDVFKPEVEEPKRYEPLAQPNNNSRDRKSDDFLLM